MFHTSVCRLLGAGVEQLALHVTHDEIIMMCTSSGARRLYAIRTRPASTATVAVFKGSLSFSTEQSSHSTIGVASTGDGTCTARE